MLNSSTIYRIIGVIERSSLSLDRFDFNFPSYGGVLACISLNDNPSFKVKLLEHSLKCRFWNENDHKRIMCELSPGRHKRIEEIFLDDISLFFKELSFWVNNLQHELDKYPKIYDLSDESDQRSQVYNLSAVLESHSGKSRINVRV